MTPIVPVATTHRSADRVSGGTSFNTSVAITTAPAHMTMESPRIRCTTKRPVATFHHLNPYLRNAPLASPPAQSMLKRRQEAVYLLCGDDVGREEAEGRCVRLVVHDEPRFQ
jgi:hypothetical protein